MPPSSSGGGILSPFRSSPPLNHFQSIDGMMAPPGREGMMAPTGREGMMAPPGSSQQHGGSGGSRGMSPPSMQGGVGGMGGPMQPSMHPDSQMHGGVQDRLPLPPPSGGVGGRPPPRGTEASMYQGGVGDMTHMGPIPPARQANGGMMRQHQQQQQQSHYPFDRGPPDGMPYRNDATWGRDGYGNGGGGGGGGNVGPPGIGYNNPLSPRQQQQQSQGGFPPMPPPSHLMGGVNIGGGGISGPNNRSGMATAHEILESYKDVGDDNEIVKHARTMLISAQSMHNFTLGEGRVKTTQDFFTKAEAFSEDTNKMYKLMRMFSYQVPSGEDKRTLMQSADNLPRHCGQMQLLIQLPGMGKESTFRKVDSIIKENNQIMYRIAKIVELCFMNCKKYDLDFRGITLSKSASDGDGDGSPFGSGSGGAGSASSSMASDIGFGSSRRPTGPAPGAGGNKRTRVSFLLY